LALEVVMAGVTTVLLPLRKTARVVAVVEWMLNSSRLSSAATFCRRWRGNGA
jgi:hypothetical protein